MFKSIGGDNLLEFIALGTVDSLYELTHLLYAFCDSPLPRFPACILRWLFALILRKKKYYGDILFYWFSAVTGSRRCIYIHLAVLAANILFFSFILSLGILHSPSLKKDSVVTFNSRAFECYQQCNWVNFNQLN